MNISDQHLLDSAGLTDREKAALNFMRWHPEWGPSRLGKEFGFTKQRAAALLKSARQKVAALAAKMAAELQA